MSSSNPTNTLAANHPLQQQALVIEQYERNLNLMGQRLHAVEIELASTIKYAVSSDRVIAKLRKELTRCNKKLHKRRKQIKKLLRYTEPSPIDRVDLMTLGDGNTEDPQEIWIVKENETAVTLGIEEAEALVFALAEVLNRVRRTEDEQDLRTEA